MLQPSGDPPLPSAVFIERRRGYRQAIKASALLRPVAASSQDPPIPVHVFEYAISGVAFSSARSLDVGTVWRFDMCDKRQTARRVEIRSCRPRPDGMFDLGAMFC